jgi:hypothetical protein
MSLLGLYNVDEGADGAKRVDDPAVSVSGPVFVEQGFIQNFFQRKVVHVSRPAV